MKLDVAAVKHKPCSRERGENCSAEEVGQSQSCLPRAWEKVLSYPLIYYVFGCLLIAGLCL